MIHWHPFICYPRIDRLMFVLCAEITEKIPRRVHKGIHRIAVRIQRTPLSQVYGLHKSSELRKGDSPVGLNSTSSGSARQDRQARESPGHIIHIGMELPITLLRYQPVTQAKLTLALPNPRLPLFQTFCRLPRG